MKCEQKNCQADAEFTVYWPGQTTKQCEFHTQQLRGLAGVMGFHVGIEPITKEDEQT